MKKKLLVILLLLSGGSAFSQMNGDYNYSIAARGFSMMQMPKILNETDYSKYVNTYFSGLVMKFNDNQISYRLGGSYLKKSKTFYNNCNTCEIVTGDVTDYAFKVGFEKNLNFSRIQPYFGVDLGYRSNKFIGLSQNANVLKNALQSDAIASSKVEATKVGFIATPLIGIKFNVINEVSLFVESSLDFFYSYERQEFVTQDASNVRTLAKTNKAEFLLNPVSVGIAIHLGSNK